MSTTPTRTAGRLATTAEPSPPCPECAVALLPVGSGRHLYWSCQYCGTTMRRL